MTAAIRSALLTLLWTAAAVGAQNAQTAPGQTSGNQLGHEFQPPAVERN
jgi:hypothetical protein